MGLYRIKAPGDRLDPIRMISECNIKRDEEQDQPIETGGQRPYAIGILRVKLFFFSIKSIPLFPLINSVLCGRPLETQFEAIGIGDV